MTRGLGEREPFGRRPRAGGRPPKGSLEWCPTGRRLARNSIALSQEAAPSRPCADPADTFPALRRSPWEIAVARWLAVFLGVAVALELTAAAAGASGTLYGSSNTGTTRGGPRVPELTTINIGTGSATLVGPLPFPGTGTTAGVTEIVCQPGATSAATAVCYAQQADGGFHISQFDLSTGAAIGSPVFDGDSFAGLAYVGSTLYGTAIVSGTLRILNPETGTSVDVGPTGAGDPVSGLVWTERRCTGSKVEAQVQGPACLR